MEKTEYVISPHWIFCRKVSVSLCPWWVMEWIHRLWWELWMWRRCDDGWTASATGLPWKATKKMNSAGSGFDLWASNYINSGQGRLPGRTATVGQGHTWLLQVDSHLDRDATQGKHLSWWEKLVLNAFLSPTNLNMLIIQFLLMCLFSLLVDFSAAF